ncbi:MAG TPA: hypothetical protein VF262_02895 [Burkholderiales bacterium]
MARFLIEVPHEANAVACSHAVQIFLNTGSHFLTHADFGCADGEHKGWLTVEVDSKEEARRILPPAMRARARIVRLSKFSLTHVGALLKDHLQDSGREAARAAA